MTKGKHTVDYEAPASSMTMRDHFAAAIQFPDEIGAKEATVLMGEPPVRNEHGYDMQATQWWATAEAKRRYMLADAMIRVRNV